MKSSKKSKSDEDKFLALLKDKKIELIKSYEPCDCRYSAISTPYTPYNLYVQGYGGDNGDNFLILTPCKNCISDVFYRKESNDYT